MALLLVLENSSASHYNDACKQASVCELLPSRIENISRHLGLLSDATARYDYRHEGQLGDVLFEDGRTVMAILGSSATAAAHFRPARSHACGL